MTEEGQTDAETKDEGVDLLAVCLRSCFTADNYANLGDDLISLLLHLSREPIAPPAPARPRARVRRFWRGAGSKRV